MNMFVITILDLDAVAVTADSRCTLLLNLLIFIFIGDQENEVKSPEVTLIDLCAASVPQYHQKLPTGFTSPTVFKIGEVL